MRKFTLLFLPVALQTISTTILTSLIYPTFQEPQKTRKTREQMEFRYGPILLYGYPKPLSLALEPSVDVQGRAETNCHWHLIYATPAVRKHSSVNPKSALGLSQAVAEVNACHD